MKDLIERLEESKMGDRKLQSILQDFTADDFASAPHREQKGLVVVRSEYVGELDRRTNIKTLTRKLRWKFDDVDGKEFSGESSEEYGYEIKSLWKIDGDRIYGLSVQTYEPFRGRWMEENWACFVELKQA